MPNSVIAHIMATAHGVGIGRGMSGHEDRALKKVLYGRVLKPKLTRVN